MTLQLANSQAARVLAATGILWLTAFFALKHALWRDPHTAFFKEEGVYDLGYSTLRQTEAQQFISGAHNTPSIPSTNDPLICAAFTTFQREGRQYLQEAIGSMLVSLTPAERSALDLHLLFTHVEPSISSDWNSSWLSLLDHWGSYNVSLSEIKQVAQWEAERNFYAKGVYDYNYLLDACLGTSAPYIAVFEDDIIFAEGWLAKTLRGLAQLKAQKRKKWLYLRLFYTETSLGWEKEDFWYRNMPLAFILPSALVGLVLLLLRRTHKARQALDPLSCAAVVCISVPAFVALAFMSGKYNLAPLRGVVEMNKFGCCTQALVFPRYQVESLRNFLRERGSGQTDALIEEYADRSGLARYALAPQVVQHVGMVSSRDNLAINTRSTWAFWFETQTKERLAREKEAVGDTEHFIRALREGG
ncbi:Hypothetical protein D9617_1g086790 [Elsinoe fawcettii]|nr:Hypothetical protein D9617_1g086790 [Elsinoe fawcettii]